MAFADAAGDQLGVLAAEVQDQDQVLHCIDARAFRLSSRSFGYWPLRP